MICCKFFDKCSFSAEMYIFFHTNLREFINSCYHYLSIQSIKLHHLFLCHIFVPNICFSGSNQFAEIQHWYQLWIPSLSLVPLQHHYSYPSWLRSCHLHHCFTLVDEWFHFFVRVFHLFCAISVVGICLVDKKMNRWNCSNAFPRIWIEKQKATS